MNQPSSPFIASETSLPEITLKVIVLSVVLALILAMSNAYLALKVGILISTSIPAAILSMGILRCCRGANILENNLVQTAASAGGAVAGGVVYTTPALILIHFWGDFDYFDTFFIALSGGLLGVLFSIPLRRVLVTDPKLPFPEGRAIAEVLIAGTERTLGFREIVLGGAVGALVELLQIGFKVLASSAQWWWAAGKTVVGFGAGFSATMLGVGYLIGFQVGASLFVGALLGWLLGIPLLSSWLPAFPTGTAPTVVAMTLWSEHIRYVGVGAMLFAGLCTLGCLVKPFIKGVINASLALHQRQHGPLSGLPRIERDLPISYVIVGSILILISLCFFLTHLFPFYRLGLSGMYNFSILMGSVVYIALMGIIFSAITGYFSGLVGVTASPGSAVVIAALLLAAVLLRLLLDVGGVSDVAQSKMAAAAITIALGAIVTGAAAIANDNIQDLKAGHLLGATPWKQQVMLMLGVVLSAAIIPLVMELLFNVYGIGDVLPRAGMDPEQALPAPPAAMMAAITQGIFDYNLPWSMILLGAGLVAVLGIVNRLLLPMRFRLSLLGVAMGIYLPLATSIPLFLGSLLALLTRRRLQQLRADKVVTAQEYEPRWQRGVLAACGLVSGAALMDVVLAIPFALSGSPDVMQLLPAGLPVSVFLAIIGVLLMCLWIYRLVTRLPR